MLRDLSFKFQATFSQFLFLEVSKGDTVHMRGEKSPALVKSYMVRMCIHHIFLVYQRTNRLPSVRETEEPGDTLAVVPLINVDLGMQACKKDIHFPVSLNYLKSTKKRRVLERTYQHHSFTIDYKMFVTHFMCN